MGQFKSLFLLEALNLSPGLSYQVAFIYSDHRSILKVQWDEINNYATTGTNWKSAGTYGHPTYISTAVLVLSCI